MTYLKWLMRRQSIVLAFSWICRLFSLRVTGRVKCTTVSQSCRIAKSESRGCVVAVEDRTQFTMQVGSDDILFKALVHSRDAVCRMFELLDGEDGRKLFTTSVERFAGAVGWFDVDLCSLVGVSLSSSKMLTKHVVAKQVQSSQKCSQQSQDDENHKAVAFTSQ